MKIIKKKKKKFKKIKLLFLCFTWFFIFSDRLFYADCFI